MLKNAINMSDKETYFDFFLHKVMVIFDKII